MAKGMYIGDPSTGLAKKVKKLYIGDPSTGVARKVKKVYIGDPTTGLARLAWSNSGVDVILHYESDSGTLNTKIYITDDRTTFTLLTTLTGAFTAVCAYPYDSQGVIANTDEVYLVIRKYPVVSDADYYLMYKLNKSTRQLTFLKNYNVSYSLRDFVIINSAWMFLDSANGYSMIKNYEGSQISFTGYGTLQRLTMTDKAVMYSIGTNYCIAEINKSTGAISAAAASGVNFPDSGGYINGIFYFISQSKVYYSSTPLTGFTQKVLDSTLIYGSQACATGNGVSVALCAQSGTSEKIILATKDGINFTRVATLSNGGATVVFDGNSFKICGYNGYIVSEDGYSWTTVAFTGLYTSATIL